MAGLWLDPGRLSTRLRLESPADEGDGQGGVDGGWTVIADLWGRVEPLRAVPREEAGAAIAPVIHRVTIRHRQDVCQDMRFVFRGRSLLVRAVRDPDESRRYLICDCEETRP
ncbi:MAG: phage head closure protein [Hoeflea sp.]|uniref:phage head closure protein n=1 Tax=Hoeflea sp. TaxID=1940281 RepID=UPI0032EAA486